MKQESKQNGMLMCKKINVFVSKNSQDQHQDLNWVSVEKSWVWTTH